MAEEEDYVSNKKGMHVGLGKRKCVRLFACGPTTHVGHDLGQRPHPDLAGAGRARRKRGCYGLDRLALRVGGGYLHGADVAGAADRGSKALEQGRKGQEDDERHDWGGMKSEMKPRAFALAENGPNCRRLPPGGAWRVQLGKAPWAGCSAGVCENKP